MIGTRLGASQRRIVEELKRRGPTTIPALAAAIDLNVETVRAHMRALDREGLVQRTGSQARGPGRPEIVYALAPSAEALFPNREGEVLQELARHLEDAGEQDLLRGFFADYVARRRPDAMQRLEALEGEERLREVARILTDMGFMAEIRMDADGRQVLRLCHCPLRNLVAATRAPCRAELGFVRELLGSDLARITYIPAGDPACSYSLTGRS